MRACWITERDSWTLDWVPVRTLSVGFSARKASIRWTRAAFGRGSCGGGGSDGFVVGGLGVVRWDGCSGVMVRPLRCGEEGGGVMEISVGERHSGF